MHPLLIASLVMAGMTALVLPYYCKITYPGKSTATIVTKMCLAAMFFLSSVFVVIAAPVKTDYVYIQLIAFLMCVAGDYILGSSDRMRMFVFGSLCFAAAHVLFITAFSRISKAFFPQIPWWNGLDLGVFLVYASVMVLIFVVRKPPFHKLFIPMFIYFFLVALMASKAAGLGIRMLSSAPAMAMLPVGGLLFLASDFTLGMLRFKVHPKTVPFKSFCTASYFVAQMLIVLSMHVMIQQ